MKLSAIGLLAGGASGQADSVTAATLLYGVTRQRLEFMRNSGGTCSCGRDGLCDFLRCAQRAWILQ